jgi:hypothetical protein
MHDLLEGESYDSSSESSPGEDSHYSWQCNIVHAARMHPTGGAGNKPNHPPVPRTLEEQAAYKRERAERVQARTADKERARNKRACDQCMLDSHTARGRARAVNNKILRDEHGMPYFPRTSQNVIAAASMMRAMSVFYCQAHRGIPPMW